MAIDKRFGRGGLNEQVNPAELLDSIGLDDDELAWRKEHINFDETDVERLSALEDVFRAHDDEIADRFYENLTNHDRTLEIFSRSPKGIEELKETQRAYLVTLSAGNYGEEYFRDRARIGKLHDLLEMPLNHYIGQYGIYYTLLLEVLDDRIQENVVEAIREWTVEEFDDSDETGVGSRLFGAFGRDDAHGETGELSAALEETVREEIHANVQDLLSVLRIINLDMQVAVDTYVDSYSSQIEAEAERRAQLAKEVQRDAWNPLRDLNTAAGEVARSAEEISARTEQSTEGITAIADELANVGAATEEIASTASEVEETARHARRTAQNGRNEAERAFSAVSDVTEATRDVGEEVADLECVLDDLDDTLESLDEVTRQTKRIGREATLQSTQASGDRETLRALADEVKSFADETERRLESVYGQVESMHDPLRSTAESVEVALDEVEDGTECVESCMQSLDEIVDAIEEATDGVGDVADATESQAESAEGVAAAADQAAAEIDAIAGETSDIAAATEEQKAQLAQIVHSLKRLTEENETVEATG